MSNFDPYLKWLGIRETHRPVNHYRLLGLELFESDTDVISTAADRQMAHVRTFQNGARAELSQKILNELAVARRCLLMADQKAEYDKRLRKTLETNTPPAAVQTAQPVPVAKVQPATPPIPPVAVNSRGANVSVRSDANLRNRRQKLENSRMKMSIVGWIGGGLAAVAVGAYLITSGILPGYGDQKSSPIENPEVLVAKKDDPASKRTPSKSATSEQNKRNQTPRKQSPKKQNPESQTKKQQPPVTPNNPDKESDPNVKKPKVTDSSHPDFVWNRFNLQQYPSLDDNSRKLLALVKNSVSNDQLLNLPPSNAIGGDSEYRLVDGNILVGLVLSPYKDGTIRTLAPIRLHQQGIRVGRQYGRQYNPESYLLAKPGYAVGAIEVSTNHPMRCLRLVYMRILEDRLDANDQYTSDWYPKKVRPYKRIENTNGFPVVGIHGRYLRSSNVSTLGLIGTMTNADLIAKAGSAANTNTSQTDTSTTASALPAPPSATEVETARGELLVLYEQQIQQAMPNQQALKSNRESVRNAELAASRRRARDLARLITNDAYAESGNPTTQFTMFREVAAIGTRIGDLEIVLDSMREIKSRFDYDYWAPMKTVIRETAANAAATEAFVFRQNLDGLIDEAIGDGEFKTADWMVNWALNQTKNTDRNQAEKYKKLERQVSSMAKLQAANDRSLKTLITDPENAKANENVGMFQFMVKQDTEKALQFWGKSDDPRLLKLVQVSSATDTNDSKSLLALSESWRECGEANRTFKDKRFLKQALEFIERASGLTEGLEKRRIDRMASELKAEIDGE